MRSSYRSPDRSTSILLVLLLLLAFANLASTCVAVEPGGEEPAYGEESANQQMEDEEVGELDRETDS